MAAVFKSLKDTAALLLCKCTPCGLIKVPYHLHCTFQIIDDFNPDTYNYLLGPSILVAPIISNDSTVSITFPVGSNWVYWWDHSKVYQGGSTFQLTAVPLEEFPVFFKNGTSTNLFLYTYLSHSILSLPPSTILLLFLLCHCYLYFHFLSFSHLYLTLSLLPSSLTPLLFVFERYIPFPTCDIRDTTAGGSRLGWHPLLGAAFTFHV